ncbi:MAG: hypothetical protein AB7I34_11105 [Rhizobiaceae bacterium]
MRFIVAALFLASGIVAAGAFDWGHYVNQRFGYSIDIPPEFSAIEEADNGDGGMSRSDDKLSELAVWGSNLVEGDLSDDFASRLAAAEAHGWTVSYRRETPTWASWSGSQQGRLFYARAIALCGGQAAYFLFEYPRARQASYDPVVKRLVKSLKNARSC